MLHRFFAIIVFCLFTTTAFAQVDNVDVQATAVKEPTLIRLGEPNSPLIAYSEAETAYLSSLSGDALVLPIMATADDEIIVLRSETLAKTNAEDLFSERLEEVEELSVLNLSLPELRTLELVDETKAFAHTESLTRHLEIIKTIREKESRPVKIVFELRKPWLHKQNNKDLSALLLKTLATAPLSQETELFVSSYDPDELEHLMSILPQALHPLSLTLIMGDNNSEEAKQDNFGSWQSYDYNWLYTTTGLRFISSFATAIAFDTKAMLASTERRVDFVKRSKSFNLNFWVLESTTTLESIGDNLLPMDLIDGIASSHPERFIQPQEIDSESESEDVVTPITTLLSELNISTTQALDRQP